MKNKVLVALSGGVDSSTVAALLLEQGFEVGGVHMRLWNPERKKTDAEQSAKKVAEHLGIPLYIVDLGRKFKQEIVDYFISEYLAGRTPNPCVVCNKKIKFGFLLQEAKKLGYDFLATGHYADQGEIKNQKSKIKKFQLFKGIDKDKDQSYFLWKLNQKQLSRILFPLGRYKKEETRELARKFGLHTAERRESQEICFVPGKDYRVFLEEMIPKKLIKPGDIVRRDGRILGKHQGLPFYTIGQRKGLGISAENPAYNPWYVVKLDVKDNRIIVGREEDLYQQKVNLKSVNWILGKAPKGLLKCQVRIRYGMEEQSAIVRHQSGKRYQVVFDKPQRAITPGQSAVFYSGDEVLGGGIII